MSNLDTNDLLNTLSESGQLTRMSLGNETIKEAYLGNSLFWKLGGSITQEQMEEYVADNAAPKNHNHTIAQVTGLQSAIDAKANVDEVPSKTSQLENDTGFAKIFDINTVTDWIDTTEDWVYINGFHLADYPIPAEQDIHFLYSPEWHKLYIAGQRGAVVRSTVLSNSNWDRALYYNGNLFYDSYMTDKGPIPYYGNTVGIGTQLFPASNSNGVSTAALGRIGYTGGLVGTRNECGIAFKLYINDTYNNSYGFFLAGLCFDVTPR